MKKTVSLLKKVYTLFCDIIEIYLPMLIFVFLFGSYMVLIVYRYILKASFDWLYELNALSFVWCAILAASYGSRNNSHVQFTIIYDRVSPKWQLFMRILANLLIVILLTLLLPDAVSNLNFMKVRKSPILKIPYNYVFSPFLLFLGLTILHNLIQLVKDILILLNKKEKE